MPKTIIQCNVCERQDINSTSKKHYFRGKVCTGYPAEIKIYSESETTEWIDRAIRLGTKCDTLSKQIVELKDYHSEMLEECGNTLNKIRDEQQSKILSSLEEELKKEVSLCGYGADSIAGERRNLKIVKEMIDSVFSKYLNTQDVSVEVVGEPVEVGIIGSTSKEAVAQNNQENSGSVSYLPQLLEKTSNPSQGLSYEIPCKCGHMRYEHHNERRCWYFNTCKCKLFSIGLVVEGEYRSESHSDDVPSEQEAIAGSTPAEPIIPVCVCGYNKYMHGIVDILNIDYQPCLFDEMCAQKCQGFHVLEGNDITQGDVSTCPEDIGKARVSTLPDDVSGFQTPQDNLMRCFWCVKDWNDIDTYNHRTKKALIKHTKEFHPGLNARSYDFKSEEQAPNPDLLSSREYITLSMDDMNTLREFLGWKLDSCYYCKEKINFATDKYSMLNFPDRLFCNDIVCILQAIDQDE